MKLGAVSRHLVSGMVWSLRMIAKNIGVSTASVAWALRQGGGQMKRLRQVERSESLSGGDEGKLCLWRGETITTSQLFSRQWCITVGLSQIGRWKVG